MNDNEEKQISEAYDRGELKLEEPSTDLLRKLAGTSDFVVRCAREAASRKICEQKIMALSQRDRQIFVEALLGEAEPGEEMKKSVEEYLDGSSTAL
ncbi:DUF1778 domain-containing protein [Desulfonatronum sp. SC1]|uniref:type II toxin-antitoxin system TacA family antitoxin n=1 Tax=Desulfonatronum sp. SC1 TaxID=2109626 RepID=UPI000D3166FB|nr:DUF1778 domain-containing protein [Desulfonatronum sp. SC1]PTN37550.1 DUF1778 domain-containing protein [Desulfonatronum sp. SC1]